MCSLCVQPIAFQYNTFQILYLFETWKKKSAIFDAIKLKWDPVNPFIFIKTQATG